MKRFVVLILVFLSLGLLVGCNRKADIASKNLSKAADNFQIERKIVFYNGITGANFATIEGKCSLGNDDPAREVTVTCKVGPNSYTKDLLGLSDNVTYFVLQENGFSVSDLRKRITIRPGTIVPDITFGG